MSKELGPLQNPSCLQTGLQALKCDNVQILGHKPIPTKDGDNTVVLPSAVALKDHGNTVYLNLERLKVKHHNILDSPTVVDVIGQTLLGQPVETSATVSVEPPDCQSTRWWRIIFGSPGILEVFDDAGRHTGPLALSDTGGSLTVFEENIPGSSYEEYDGRTYLSLESSGSYRVAVTAFALGTFDLHLEDYLGDTMLSSIGFHGIPALPGMRADLMLDDAGPGALAIDIEDDDVIDFVLSPSTTPQPEQSLVILRAVLENLELPLGIRTSLVSKVREAEGAVRHGRDRTAISILDAMINEIAALPDRMILSALALELATTVQKMKLLISEEA